MLEHWETRIREELKGLTAVKATVEHNPKIESAVKTRLIDVIRTLKVKLVTLLAQCGKARDELDSGVDVARKVDSIATDYQSAVQSIERLSQLTGNRIKDPPAVTEPRVAPQSGQPEKDPIALLLTEIEGLKRLVQRTDTHIAEHEHSEYWREVQELTQDSDKLRVETAAFSEQHKAIAEMILSLQGKVDSVEGGKSYDAPRKPAAYLIPRGDSKQ